MTFSVIIPLYNKSPYIRRAIDSVLAQTYPRFELIVVDDGSTDSGPEIVRGLADPRLRLLSQRNLGVAAARNLGLAAAVHDRVAFLDADDEWAPGFLVAGLNAYATFPDLAAVFTNFRTGYRRPPVLRPDRGACRLLNDYGGFCLANTGAGMTASTVMATRQNLLAMGGFPVGRTQGEDLDTWIRLAWSGPVAYIPEPLAIYHEDCGASKTRVANLDVMATFLKWKRSGRIPESQRDSAFAFAALCRLRTAFFLSQAGLARKGLRLHRNLPFRSRLSLHGIAAYISLRNRACGRPVFSAAEAVNRLTAYWLWRRRAGV
jgi:glycosyltransferase involved in cell wall biosynthesis